MSGTAPQAPVFVALTQAGCDLARALASNELLLQEANGRALYPVFAPSTLRRILDTLLGDQLAETVAFNRVLGNRFLIVPGLSEERRNSRQAWLSKAQIFDQVADVFVEHAPGDALSLMPGHAYYLASSDAQLHDRFRYELIPLLDEYLEQGLLGPAGSELHAVRDAIEDLIEGHAG